MLHTGESLYNMYHASNKYAGLHVPQSWFALPEFEKQAWDNFAAHLNDVQQGVVMNGRVG